MKTCEKTNKRVTAIFNKENPYWDTGGLGYNVIFVRTTESIINDMLDYLPNGTPIPLTDVFRYLGIPTTFTSILYEYIAGRHHLSIDFVNQKEVTNEEAEELILAFNTDECYCRFED